jgi:hypothetical protein
MAKGKGGAKPAPAVKTGPDRNNGKTWKKRPLIFDAIKRKLRVMTSAEYDLEKEKSKLSKQKSQD